jgi:hypothetical protein
MKNYIQDYYPEKMSYDVLRAAVNAAWLEIGQVKFKELIESMRHRCMAVMDANGMHTEF